ncbi:MAG: type I pullulanase [Corynebacterium sp.]|uniref:type I pullulanase n=1 Tax=Corynebacterium sp. TaxID=1720 RepID=UPI0026DC0D77|nr:type I pullulanase [Corynebacterium sp.]MDO4761751.1 type I pullulanase [Corynebacterium sp.]
MTDNYPVYHGELGALYNPEGTTFRLWAPTATDIKLHLPSGVYPLTQGTNGEWETYIEGDYHLAEYLYELTFPDGSTTTTVDPYARSVTANGHSGVVIDLHTLIPRSPRMPSFPDPTEAIIYEAHIRDLTISPTNGITHKGKFLGLTETGTRTTKGNLSGLDYLTNLGVTHIQLLPVFDFGSVDESGDLSFNAQYNWGYDPVHYNTPEGSYSTNPHDPTSRIIEFKQLIDTLHNHGLRVIMDVVYNHVYDVDTNPLQRTTPGYYFRQTPEGTWHNATGCGNETASERPMMRKFIVDSVVHWARTYGIDGFRFDLMGIHDVDTINAVRAALDDIDPGIIIIGEGWEMGNHPQGVRGANQKNASLIPRVGMFNDFYRDVVKGNNFTIGDSGFVSGGGGDLASKLFDALTPIDASQNVVYNEAHDNWTMFDKLVGTATLQGASISDIAKRHTLATATQYLARGIVFVHAGQEFLRTKLGEENSYKSPDSVNAFDYDRAAEFAKESGFLRHLNVFRRKYAWTRSSGYTPERLIAEGSHLSYRVADAFGKGRDAFVLINASEHPLVHSTPEGKYRVHITDGTVFHDPQPIELSGEYVVNPLRVVVLEHAG